MITINLRPGSKRAKGGGSSAASLLASIKGLGSKVKDPLMAAAVGAWVVALGFLGFVYLTTSSRLHSLEPRLEQARAENRRYQNVLRQKRKIEAVRDSIIAQIRTIRDVDSDRYVWPHMLDEIARAMPPYTWLTSLEVVEAAALPGDTTSAEPAVQLQVSGRTTDIQGYTRLLRQLEDSPWLGEVTAVEAKTVVEQGRAVTAFVLRASFTKADSAYVQSVPVAQSVVR